MKIPPPNFTWHKAICPRCKQTGTATYLAIAFSETSFWLVDGSCWLCDADLGKGLVQQYDPGTVILEDRPCIQTYNNGMCPTCLNPSSFYSVFRDDEIIAGRCRRDACGFYHLPSGVRKAYDNHMLLTPTSFRKP